MPGNTKHNLLVILGPTASGKTGIAVRLASEIGGEIISADSRQVYRGMDLGTGKDLSEYEVGGRFVPYHLIDVIDPREEFNLFAFQRAFAAAYREVRNRGKAALLVGGTGLYLESVILKYPLRAVPEDPDLRERLAGLDMEALRDFYFSMTDVIPHNRTDLDDRDRLIRAVEIARHGGRDPAGVEEETLDAVSPLTVGIRWERGELRGRITRRLRDRLDAGLIEEVRALKDGGVSWERLDAFGLEYRYIARYLRGRLSEREMFRSLETKIHQFAKRQETWFRRMERKGVAIRWFHFNDYDMLLEYVQERLSL